MPEDWAWPGVRTDTPFCQTVEDIQTPQGVVVVRMYEKYSMVIRNSD